MRRYLLFWVFLLLSLQCGAQLQFPGKPYGKSGAWKAMDVMYVLPPVDPLEMDAAFLENRETLRKSLRFALQRQAGIDPASHGGWLSLPDYRLWRVHIVSTGAFSVGLLFNKYELAEGVKLFVYDPGMQYVRGAFTSGNNKSSGLFGTGHIPGHEVVVEMQVPHHLDNYGSLRIESVSHAFLAAGEVRKPDDIRFGRSQDCEIDINCGEGAHWQQSKRSVVRILTRDQYCTGVLLNNTAFDGSPLILTAEHCIQLDTVAKTSIFVFNYESSECFGEDGSVEMSIFGAELLATGDSVDFSLVRLSAVPPDSFGVYYSGWDRTAAQLSYSSTIHHPMGDVKKISYDFEAPSIPTGIDDLPNSDLRDYHYFSFWWIRQWDIGTTEGGSSGGPLFNAARRVIGSLSGGKAKCGMATGYDSIAGRTIFSKTPNVNDYFTRLGVAWNYYDDPAASLKPWLDPAGTGALWLDGYEPAGTGPALLRRLNRFRVYPNPASEFLVMEPGGPLAGKVTWRLTDLSGRTVMTGRHEHAETVRISLEESAPGLYLLFIRAGEMEEYHKIMVGR